MKNVWEECIEQSSFQLNDSGRWTFTAPMSLPRRHGTERPFSIAEHPSQMRTEATHCYLRDCRRVDPSYYSVLRLISGRRCTTFGPWQKAGCSSHSFVPFLHQNVTFVRPQRANKNRAWRDLRFRLSSHADSSSPCHGASTQPRHTAGENFWVKIRCRT
jgi:hypothetical protein